jgi:hypothetical protein
MKANNIEMPVDFNDRELLKFVQANAWNLDKTGTQLANHFKWLSSIAGVTITPQIVKLI